MTVFLLSEEISFPSPLLASAEGLLAVGGDLSEERLLLAYQLGIFPWYSSGEPILWWSPDPRLVLFPSELHISRSLRKTIKKNLFHLTIDQAFHQVMAECAAPRKGKASGTWIVPEMMMAYNRLHLSGFAHSVEAWSDNELVGGLYGVAIGRTFFGESMFSRVPNVSKVVLVTFVEYLKRRSFDMIDCQVRNEHLRQFGAQEIPRTRFMDLLAKSVQRPTDQGKWAF